PAPPPGPGTPFFTTAFQFTVPGDTLRADTTFFRPFRFSTVLPGDLPRTSGAQLQVTVRAANDPGRTCNGDPLDADCAGLAIIPGVQTLNWVDLPLAASAQRLHLRADMSLQPAAEGFT
ncbi:MAG: hypothetical protein D6701_13480, partial [Gemmatimonadetes bacterium]